MGVSLATVLAIQGNKVSCQAGGPSPGNGKWAGWVMMDVDCWAPLLNTGYIYDSQEKAVSAMKSLVKVIRGLNMDTQKDESALRRSLERLHQDSQ